MKKAIIDFETKAIQARPAYPPEPIGVAVLYDKVKKYYAWGHPSENNCTKRDAVRILKYLTTNYECIFHNAAFDLEVMLKFFNIKYPAVWHDTLFLAYLYDPREKTLSLKPLADKYLDMPPLEMDAVCHWLDDNYYSTNKIKPTKQNSYGANYWRAPGSLMGKYAIGDVIRTGKLFRFYYRQIKEMGMLPAYNREIEVMSVFEAMSKRGVPIRRNKLGQGLKRYEKECEGLALKIRRRLRTKDLKISSSKQLADAMDRCKKIHHWVYTEPTDRHPDGQRSTSRENILKCCTDKTLSYLLARHGLLETLLGTFMRPWYEKSKSDGRIYPSFSQVRTPDQHGHGVFGTRTGRPSSHNPNFFNIPKNVKDLSDWGKDLPFVRDYIAPEKGHVLLNRDYEQQEIRIAAHFEQGGLFHAYVKNPKLNPHHYAHDIILKSTGIDLEHKQVKTIAFGIIYGMGIGKLAESLGVTKLQAKVLKAAYFEAFPGIKELSEDVKHIAENDEPIKTWGGRLYYIEDPIWPKPKKGRPGYWRTFGYKMLNYLIQGSAADCTKQAMINANHVLHRDSNIILQVYDELLISAPKGLAVKEMKKLKEAMESVEFDVPMLTSGKQSSVSWARVR